MTTWIPSLRATRLQRLTVFLCTPMTLATVSGRTMQRRPVRWSWA
jgi:hypothetical protein